MIDRLTALSRRSPSQVDSAQVQDSGRYTCEATNVAGKTEKNYNLNVWGECVCECVRVCVCACVCVHT